MSIRKQGDVSRRRKLVGSAARIAWYAACRARRFAQSDFRPHHHGCCTFRPASDTTPSWHRCA